MKMDGFKNTQRSGDLFFKNQCLFKKLFFSNSHPVSTKLQQKKDRSGIKKIPDLPFICITNKL